MHIFAKIPEKNSEQAMGKAPPPAIAAQNNILHGTIPGVKYFSVIQLKPMTGFEPVAC
ncbi:hypothetical protein [Nodularia sphaerocarpa]|uniref:hypothetical protein n=1 Tax=Nodularia sphaerocarpa TaxID=137816 RepID=UPI001EFB2B5E|nr:hypothetical protein [Nodularia sphaerocarpa]MDB9374535.1 hypothetical protein [Nodularia sphaerocarpa CS-585]MDB9379476.1 hypothetical protein [Nodularia sphaerocarpa CS-585A2]